MSVVSIAGGVQANATASGGKVNGFTLTVAAQVVAVANPNRRKIVFHNPGAIDIYFAPSINASGGALTLTNAGPGSFLLVANGGTWTIEGECQTAWQALCASATTPLTVMDSNI